MNQILSTSMPMDNNKKSKNKNNKPVATENVLKFFGVTLLVFGIFVIGIGGYSIYQKQVGQIEENLEPTISIENKTDTTILLKVMHQRNISKVEYSWNNGEVEILNGNNGKYLEQEIELPAGKNTLHVLVQDENGNEMTYEKQYETESEIELEVSVNKIRITYTGNTTVSYMTYRWDEEEETRVEINDTDIDQEIEALKGLHTLTVIVVDENNNTDTKQQKINGVSKPKITIGVDEEKLHFVVQTSDEEKLEKVEFRLNQDENQEYELNLQEKDLKELQYVVPFELQEGENYIEVTVYNSSGLSEKSGLIRFVK